MMTSTDLLIAACALVAVAVVAATILVGWQNWLAFKNRELELCRAPAHSSGLREPHDPVPAGARFAREGAARIELADLKERVRRLEAIANGVDL